jgi:hypothetical protein
MLDEKDCELIMSWWDIAITTSPNTKENKTLSMTFGFRNIKYSSKLHPFLI